MATTANYLVKDNNLIRLRYHGGVGRIVTSIFPWSRIISLWYKYASDVRRNISKIPIFMCKICWWGWDLSLPMTWLPWCPNEMSSVHQSLKILIITQNVWSSSIAQIVLYPYVCHYCCRMWLCHPGGYCKEQDMKWVYAYRRHAVTRRRWQREHRRE